VTAERIVAAGVEQHQIDPRAGFFQLIENLGGRDHLHEHIGIVLRVGVDRHQVIDAMRLHAMAGVIKQRDVGADQLCPKFLQRGVEAGLVEIEPGAAADHEEAERR
jgi:hypothetical protein